MEIGGAKNSKKAKKSDESDDEDGGDKSSTTAVEKHRKRTLLAMEKRLSFAERQLVSAVRSRRIWLVVEDVKGACVIDGAPETSI